jgi:rubrerythrin
MGSYRRGGWVAHLRAELVAELHPAANGKLDPHELAAASHRKLWWRCSQCGHEWEASVSNRVARAKAAALDVQSGGGRGRALASRRNARWRVTRPELAAELHPTRNGNLHPYTLGAASMQTVWWRCARCGNEWQATVANRARGTGCPSCWRKRQHRKQSHV